MNGTWAEALKSEKVGIDLNDIDFRLDELPLETRIEFNNRIQIGLAVIDGVRQENRKLGNPNKSPLSVTFYLKFVFVQACLGALGHYYGQIFYYFGLLFLSFMVYFWLQDLASTLANEAIRASANNRLAELRYRWVANGFKSDDFDSLEGEMYKYSDYDDVGHSKFSEWWHIIQLRHICGLRNLSNLPLLLGLSSCWDYE